MWIDLTTWYPSPPSSCIQWAYPSPANLAGQWSSEFCSAQTEYGNVLLEDSILCTCRQFGDLAVASNITLGYGWTWPAGVSAGFVAVVMVLVMLLHLCYLSRTQLATRILICLCLAIFLFQVRGLSSGQSCCVSIIL